MPQPRSNQLSNKDKAPPTTVVKKPRAVKATPPVPKGPTKEERLQIRAEAFAEAAAIARKKNVARAKQHMGSSPIVDRAYHFGRTDAADEILALIELDKTGGKSTT